MVMNYKEYIGREDEFDFLAGNQFCLLYLSGLREYHKVLDFGCGALRLGRLLIPYLNVGNYHGFDPNNYLWEDFIKNEFSEDYINKRKANLKNRIENIDSNYDYIIAHSIFTHTGVDLLQKYLNLFYDILIEDGITYATFYIHKEFSNKENGWKYKDCYAYTEEYILEQANIVGFKCQKINWYHPRQHWFAFYKKDQNIVNEIGKPIKNLENILAFEKKDAPIKYVR